MGRWRIVAVWAVLIGLAAWFIHTNAADFANLEIRETWLLLPVSILTLLFFASNGLGSRILYEAFGVKLTFKEWFGLSVVNTFGNLVSLFRGGAVSNAVYLKKRHGLDYSQFLVALSGTYFIVFFVNSVAGLLALALAAPTATPGRSLVTLVLAGAAVGFGALLFLPLRLGSGESGPRLVRMLARAVNGWHRIRSNRRIVWSTVGLASLNVILMGAISALEFRMVGVDVNFWESVMISVFASFSIFLGITPGGLGIREAFATLSASLINVASTPVVVASLVDRGVNFALSFALSLYFGRVLMEKLKAKA